MYTGIGIPRKYPPPSQAKDSAAVPPAAETAPQETGTDYGNDS